MTDNILKLKVKKVNKETENASAIYFEETEGREIKFIPGQFLTLIYKDNGSEVRRCYSICTSPDELPELGIAIKKMDDGYASGKLLELLTEGTVIESLRPLGSFIIDPDKADVKHYIMFGAGSGITPLFGMIKYILRSSDAKVTLFYGNTNENTIIFKQQLEELSDKYSDRFNLKHILSRPSSDWNGETGRIDESKAAELLDTFNEADLKDAEYYLCGPSDMMKAVKAAAQKKGAETDSIHKENFTLNITQEVFSDAEEKERVVTILREGETHRIRVQPGDSILEGALDSGVDLPHSCQVGVCSTCRTKLVSGSVNLVDQTTLSDEDIKQGYCLTCVGFPTSDDVVINYDDPDLW